MIIICLQGKCKTIEKFLFTKDNNYFDSIEHIDNNINDIIIKIVYKEYFCCYNLKSQLHNPIGPAIVYYLKNGIREYYYINHNRIDTKFYPKNL